MTKINDIYDELHSITQVVLPEYTELPNPYIPDDNPDIYMKKGYGISIGAASNTNRVVSKKVSILRDFDFVFVRQINSTETNTGLIKSNAKAIMEDSFKAVQRIVETKAALEEIENNTSLGQVCVKAEFVSDSGLDFIEADTQRFFILTMVVSVEYFETL